MKCRCHFRIFAPVTRTVDNFKPQTTDPLHLLPGSSLWCIRSTLTIKHVLPRHVCKPKLPRANKDPSSSSLAEPISLFTIFLRMVLVLPSFRFLAEKKIIIATWHKCVCVELPKNRAQHVVHFFLIWRTAAEEGFRFFIADSLSVKFNLFASVLYVASADSCICMYSLFFLEPSKICVWLFVLYGRILFHLRTVRKCKKEFTPYMFMASLGDESVGSFMVEMWGMLPFQVPGVLIKFAYKIY